MRTTSRPPTMQWMPPAPRRATGKFWLLTNTPRKRLLASDGAKTSYAYTYQDTGKNLPDTITITAPEVGNSTNGPGTGNAAVTVLKYDSVGQLAWIKDGENYLHHVTYDSICGRVASVVRDAASATGSPTRGSGLPTALAITTSFVYDTQGRLTKITDPGSSVSYFGYFSDRDVQVPFWNGSAALKPIRVSAFNNGDLTTDDYDLDPARAACQ